VGVSNSNSNRGKDGCAPAKMCDYSHTCEGCPHIKTEEWTSGKSSFRCFAPGKNCGYIVGIGQYLPYVPAWCPINNKEAAK
jgi:hypothetical protein